MASDHNIWYNHEMRRRATHTLAIGILVAAGLLLYREWVERNKPPLFLPLGFFESALPVLTHDDDAQNPRNWEDPLSSVAIDPTTFALQSANASDERVADVLVNGATLGGLSAAISAAEDGASVAVVAAPGWDHHVRTQATHLLTTAPDGPPASRIERSLRAWMQQRDSRFSSGSLQGTPADVERFFRERLAALPNVTLFPAHSVASFERGPDGRLSRALLRESGTARTTIVRFSYVLDGTKDGSTLALAGIPYDVSWDNREETGETRALPDVAAAALTEGYAMSGRTVPGIGRRLDGARAFMAILDRGYHGTYVPVRDVEPCWIRDRSQDAPDPFVGSGGVVLRTNKAGCSARAIVTSPFVDTVEVFVVNHGNDALASSILIDDVRMSVGFNHDPSERFVRIGAFPVGPDDPLTVELRSTLPRNRVEGIVVRKLNTSSAGERLSLIDGESKSFHAGPWRKTVHDIYVRSSRMPDDAFVAIDGERYGLSPTGMDTFVVRDVALSHGRHIVQLPAGAGPADAWIVPTRPSDDGLALRPADAIPDTIALPYVAKAAWTFAAPREGSAVFTTEADHCRESCRLTVRNADTDGLILDRLVTELSGIASRTIVLGTAELRSGDEYVVSFGSAHATVTPPSVTMVDAGAILYAADIRRAAVTPPQQGSLYDLWVRSRTTRAAVETGASDATIDSLERWTYAGTTLLGENGAVAAANGGVELLAVPNVVIDAYSVDLRNGTSVDLSGLPPGIYRATSYAVDHPRLIEAEYEDGSVQQIAFDREGAAYVGSLPLTHPGGAAVLRSPSPWPQRVILHEHPPSPLHARSVAEDADLLPLVDADTLFRLSNTLAAYGPISAEARGILFFEPRPNGIGPVTLGLLDRDSAERRMHAVIETAYMQLRHARTTQSFSSKECVGRSTPDCDARRYVREPHFFGIADAHAPSILYPDGRRLQGLETLTESGAFAFRAGCDYCSAECIPRTVSQRSCIRKDAQTRPTSGAVLTLRATEGLPAVTSPREEELGTLPALFDAMRRDALLGSAATYVEEPAIARDATLTLGMFLSPDVPNALPANTTVSATHAASRAFRSPQAELAIGSTAGHVAAFAVLERTSTAFVLRSASSMERLQLHLLRNGIAVLPTDVENDPLLSQALQYRLLAGAATFDHAWAGNRIMASIVSPERDLSTWRVALFGSDAVRTVRDALARLPGVPSDPTDGALIHFGVSTGFIAPSMLSLGANEVLQYALTPAELLKAEFLFATAP